MKAGGEENIKYSYVKYIAIKLIGTECEEKDLLMENLKYSNVP